MNELFTENNLLLLYHIIAAHLVADFVFQLNFWKKLQFKKKWISKWKPINGVFAGILTYTFVGYWDYIWLLIIIFISRILLDGLKYKKGNTLPVFMVNLMGHLAVISGCWIALVSVNIKDVIPILGSIISNTCMWTLCLSYIIPKLSDSCSHC